eukprot:CAMPEP_0179043290 /NCGR_PEP_ID=MMETSP0796-20121207/17091_1 /TAXON_ID=73915 /ORGANISM="Pyrodinium bahamense, Strain pbaha01" /LENGTH=285 /DNA_ID=CAMNT_0020739671 /DNA_START=50 /DNA_END=905 /DNA_ORIENTATION=-
MAQRRAGAALLRSGTLALAWLAATGGLRRLGTAVPGALSFASGAAALCGGGRTAASRTVTRRASEPGRVNLAQVQQLRGLLLGEEAAGAGAAAAATERSAIPTLQCDAACIAAIESCIEEGCSVEAIMKLDEALARDEAKVQSLLEREEDRAWLANFLQRTGALRAQLMAVSRNEEHLSFAEQLVRAAAVALAGAGPMTTRSPESRRIVLEWRAVRTVGLGEKPREDGLQIFECSIQIGAIGVVMRPPASRPPKPWSSLPRRAFGFCLGSAIFFGPGWKSQARKK